MICPFCGLDEKRSVEHVIGQQFAERFPNVARHIAEAGDYSEPWHHDQVVETNDGYVTRQVPRGKRTPELHKVQVTVGEACNNGWMADLDNAAVDVLDALTGRDGFRPPTVEEGVALALWLVKMGMAYDLYLPQAERGYGERLRHNFYKTRKLPAGTRVYLGYEPAQREWVPLWQRGWHVASRGTSAKKILSSPANLSTTVFGLNGLRLVAHRIAPEVATDIRLAAWEWQGLWMPKSRMVQIAPSRTAGQFESMDDDALKVGCYSLRQFVTSCIASIAPRESPME